MALSYSAIPATELAWRAADSPCLIRQKIVSPTTAKWGTTRTMAAADVSDSSFPASRAYDGFPNLLTKPNTIASGRLCYLVDLGSEMELDCAAIIGHNFGSIGATQIRLQADDVSTFPIAATMYDFGLPADTNRLVTLNFVSNNRRYTNIRYLSVTIDGTFTGYPQIGELIVGRQYQLRLKPDNPFDPTRRAREISQSVSAGGLRQTVIHHRNRFDLDANFHLWETDRITDVTNFVNGTRGNFGWIWQPTTDVSAMHWMSCDGSGLNLPSEGYTERQWNLTAQEQGPESYFLASET